MTTPDASAALHVTVAYAAPGVEVLVDVSVPVEATLQDAVVRSGIVARLALDPEQLEFAIYGQRAKGDTPLGDGDRVEITRPLVADPKHVRKLRAAIAAKRKPAARHQRRASPTR